MCAAGDFDSDAVAADFIQQYEARTEALERIVGKLICAALPSVLRCMSHKCHHGNGSMNATQNGWTGFACPSSGCRLEAILAKIIMVFFAAVACIQLIKPIGLPGLERRRDAWKLALIGFAVTVAMIAITAEFQSGPS